MLATGPTECGSCQIDRGGRSGAAGYVSIRSSTMLVVPLSDVTVT